MKTIEERAEEYTKKNFGRIADEMPIGEGMKTIFIESAKEQRDIDIEKAWRIYNMPVCGSWTKESFTKAMKGE